MRWITGALVVLGLGLISLLTVFVTTVVGFIISAFLLGAKVLTALAAVVTLVWFGSKPQPPPTARPEDP